MLTTVILAAIMMAGLFLLLYVGVGLIQDARFFSPAQKEVPLRGCAKKQSTGRRWGKTGG